MCTSAKKCLFQVSAAPRVENPDSGEKDALFGLDTQIIITIVRRNLKIRQDPFQIQ
jgi:hypothetical protein